jgi:hypothetical protein
LLYTGTIAALATELGTPAEAYEDKRLNQLLETNADAECVLRPAEYWMIEHPMVGKLSRTIEPELITGYETCE